MAMAASAMVLIVSAVLHGPRVMWLGAPAAAFGIAQLLWSLLWVRRSSLMLTWTAYFLGTYLIVTWALASTVGLPLRMSSHVTGLGGAAATFSLASMLALSSRAIVVRPAGLVLQIAASAAFPAVLFGAVSYGLLVVLDLLVGASAC
jgi:hypothetical protein